MADQGMAEIMRPSSAKAKGRRLQDLVRNDILEAFPQLEEDDVGVAIMGESGEDIHLSPVARRLIPASIECKNQERFSIWAALKQAEANASGRPPLVVFKRNHSEVYAALRWQDLLILLQRYDNS